MSEYGIGLAGFIREIEDVLAQHPSQPDDDWMTLSAREGLLSQREDAMRYLMESRMGVRARFHEGAIVGHAGPANQILKAMLALNDAVVALVNNSLTKPYKEITDEVRERLGMWVVPATAGSVVMELVCPPATDIEERAKDRPMTGQMEHPIISSVRTPAEEAVNRVMSALRCTIESSTGAALRLEDELIGLGTPVVNALARFADRCSELGAAIDITDRMPEARPIVIRTADARFLRNTIRTLGLEEEPPLIVEGQWMTGSGVRTVFDLKIQDGTIIKGRVPKTILQESMRAVGKYVQAEIHVRHRGGEGGTTSHTLRKLTVMMDHMPAGFFNE